ncbi:aryl-sulfate sulfotransferase [Fusobacterium sp. PH5-44]|uniref:aryl-sulfate sulfotransferase n=1 Tax=unclassified Fusobacterium TaxID=2648384 RepID=UPI003D21A319
MIKDLEEELIKQSEIESILLEELKNGDYTFDNPFIILDPYEESPLTALLLFNTNENVRVEISVEGKDNHSKIVHSFKDKGYIKEHIIPVYGLYSNNTNKIKITIKNENNIKKEKVFDIKTEALPSDLENIEYLAYSKNSKKYAKGLNFSYAGVNHIPMKNAFDINGDIRWYFKSIYGLPTNFNNMNSIFLSKGSYHYGDVLIIERNVLGKILRVYYSPYGNHHEIYLHNEKIYLAGSQSKEGHTVEDLISVINLNDEKVELVIDYNKILPKTRIAGRYYSNKDWLRINTIIVDDEDIIISSNVQSSIIKTDINKNIKWILSNPVDYPTKWKEKLLKPVGKDFEYSYNQHAPMILPDYDNNPDTLDILLFDNGTSRRHIENNDKSNENYKLYSRLVHYRINEKNMTVEQIWQYGKERTELFSQMRGDADLLENGNFFGTFNRDNPKLDMNNVSDTVYIEVDRDKNIVWECIAISKLDNNRHLDYRSERLEIYTEAANDIKLGVSAINLIPDEVYEKYGLKKGEIK